MQATASTARLSAGFGVLSAMADRHRKWKYSSAATYSDPFPTPALPPKTIRRHHPRVSRNQPCPCGSGKKFKRCCL